MIIELRQAFMHDAVADAGRTNGRRCSGEGMLHTFFRLVIRLCSWPSFASFSLSN